MISVDLCPECAAKTRKAKLAERHRKAAKSKPRRTAKETRIAAKMRESETRRAWVRARARGWCELCEVGDIDHIHHLEMGHGTRRQRESKENMIALCGKCHDDIHRDEAAFVPAIRAWCAKHHYPIPHRKVYR